MTDHLKFIVGELNKEPFSKNFNLINFDSLEPQELLQTLSDVLCTIENIPPIDIRQEAAEETAVRLFNTLRIMKFKAPVAAEDVSYLAKYLVKIDIPPELYGDPEIHELTAQCDELMETFKEVHRETSAAKAEGLTSEDIRQGNNCKNWSSDAFT